ncbi:MAG: hypothetical protein SNH35_05305 [Rikenellaceae bacterium]
MNEKQTSEAETIVDIVAQHCSQIKEQLDKHDIDNKYYGNFSSVVRRVGNGFCLGNDDEYPMCYVKGNIGSESCSANACQCTYIIRNEQGFLELKYPESTKVRYTYCSFSHSLMNYNSRACKKIQISVIDTDVTYPPLPDSCEELPKATKSDSGAKIVATFAIDVENGELAYVYYEHWGYSNQVTNQMSWCNPDYDVKAVVKRTLQEYGEDSVEGAQAYELLYEQQRATIDKYTAMDTSHRITDIYIKVYGETSNEPALIRAVTRELYANVRDSYVYYDRSLTCHKRMLKIKEAHPEVPFADVEELRKKVEELEDLAKDEAWERFIR